MEKNQIICNGYSAPRTHFSEATLMLLNQKIDTLRPAIKALAEMGDLVVHTCGVYYGWRCEDNNRIIATIESATTELDFLKDVDKWVMAGFQDCLGSDHWYTFEKDWG